MLPGRRLSSSTQVSREEVTPATCGLLSREQGRRPPARHGRPRRGSHQPEGLRAGRLGGGRAAVAVGAATGAPPGARLPGPCRAGPSRGRSQRRSAAGLGARTWGHVPGEAGRGLAPSITRGGVAGMGLGFRMPVQLQSFWGRDLLIVAGTRLLLHCDRI